MYKHPQSKVLELWKLTTKTRLTYIHKSQESPNLLAILDAWPRLADHDGHILVRLCILYYYFENFCIIVKVFIYEVLASKGC